MTWCQVINNYLCDSKDELCPVWLCRKERFRMTTQFPAYWDLSTLWGAKHDVNSARTVNLMLLGDDNGKRRPSSAHIVQGLRQWHLCVEEDQVHYHAQIPHLPPHWLRVLPTTKQSQQFNKSVTYRNRNLGTCILSTVSDLLFWLLAQLHGVYQDSTKAIPL